MPTRDGCLARVPTHDECLARVPTRDACLACVPTHDECLACVPTHDEEMGLPEAKLVWASCMQGLGLLVTLSLAASPYTEYR